MQTAVSAGNIFAIKSAVTLWPRILLECVAPLDSLSGAVAFDLAAAIP
jgi:hypothetical protein